MNTDQPHEIVYTDRKVLPPRKWLPLTDAEATMLEPLNANQRAQWQARLPIEERLKRFEAAETSELP